MALKFMYITNRPETAVIAQRHGVDRIWIDLEVKGKEKRQKGLDSVKSHHKLSDISSIKTVLTTSELLVRINPWDEESEKEINNVLDLGADLIMLPMWKKASEVQAFIQAVGGRAKTVLLLETREAVECLDRILGIPGIDEIHIGLNDLHLSYGMSFMFELLADGIVEEIIKKIRALGIPYGFGGIARIGQGELPAENIIIEHYRLGSTRVILSRTFCNADSVSSQKELDKLFCEEMRKVRDLEETVKNYDDEMFENNRRYVVSAVEQIVKRRK